MSERVIKGYFLRVSDEGMQFKGDMAEFVDTVEDRSIYTMINVRVLPEYERER